ncbi:MAG: PilZ domain-containing protein, partial [Vulcanimicrobiaceae bacterium]
MSEYDARLRAGVMLPPQTGVSFRWVGPSREAIVVHGHVSDIRMADKRTAEYAIEFNMPADTQDHLARELQRLHRRKLPRPVLALAPAAFEDDESDGLADLESSRDRKAYRAMVQFPVGVKTVRKGKIVTLEAEARDLSIGGMMLLLPDELEDGADLELSFALPADAHGTETTKEVVEMTPFGERRVRKSAPKRRIEQLFVKARVLKKTGNARNGSPLYGVEFVEVPAFLTEEVARWIHAHQIKQLRKGSTARKTPLRIASTGNVQRSEPKAPSHKTVRAMFTPHASERRFTFAAYAKNHEIVRLPQHASKP